MFSFKYIVSTAKVTGLSPLYETKGKKQKLHPHIEFILLTKQLHYLKAPLSRGKNLEE